MAVITYRLVKGLAITATEYDGTIHNLDDRVTALEESPPGPVEPVSLELTTTSLSIGWSNGTTTGPVFFTMPLPQYRGDWQPDTTYHELNFFRAPNGELGVVIYDHVSEDTFDWSLENDSAGEPVYRSISGSATGALAGLSDVLITDPQGGQALVYDADQEKWVNADVPSGGVDSGAGNVFNNGGSTANNIPIFADDYGEEIYDSGVSINDLRREYLWYAVGDETTDITTGTSKLTVRMPFSGQLLDVRASLATASSSGVVTVDVNNTTVSVLTPKLTIDQSEKTSVTAATAASIIITGFSDDDEFTFDIDTAGTGAKGLKVLLIVRRT